MNKFEPGTPQAAELRKQAEKAVLQSEAGSHTDLSHEDLQKVVHELSVHQFELEMQNEEMRRIQSELAVAKDRYIDLYDFTPLSYFTVSETWLIVEANLTTAAMLGVARGELIKTSFNHFIFKDDQDVLYRFRNEVAETDSLKEVELRIVKHDGTLFWASLAASRAIEDRRAHVLRIMLSDISARKRTETEVTQQLAELKRWHGVTLGREGRITELKREVNALYRRLGEKDKYESVE